MNQRKSDKRKIKKKKQNKIIVFPFIFFTLLLSNYGYAFILPLPQLHELLDIHKIIRSNKQQVQRNAETNVSARASDSSFTEYTILLLCCCWCCWDCLAVAVTVTVFNVDIHFYFFFFFLSLFIHFVFYL